MASTTTTTTTTTTDTPTSSDQLRNYRPELTTDTVHVLVRDLYGLHVLSCRELDSYDDRNFHVRVSDDRALVSNDHLLEVWPHGYVFKVLNSLDSQRPQMIEAKTTMTAVAASKGFPCPRPVPSLNGQLHVLQPLTTEHSRQQQDGPEADKGAGQTEVFLIRLMDYLPGSILASMTLTPDLSFQIGQYAARLDLMLKEVDDSHFPELRVKWNMQNVPSLRHLMPFVDDAEVAKVMAEVIDAFETLVLKCEDGLRTGLIHSDFNDNNILVEPVVSSTDPSSSPSSLQAMRVSGILDFGDATKTFLLIEVAIAMSYLTLMCTADLDPDEIAGHVLAGYMSEFPLTEAELELIPLTICARWSQSMICAYHRRVLEPDNAHCQRHAAMMWPHMRRLWARPLKETLHVWREVARRHRVIF